MGQNKSKPTSSVNNNGAPRRRIRENVLLVWVDANINASDKDCQHTLEQLRSVVNDVTTFTEPHACVEFLAGVQTEKALVITSGSLGQDLIPRIHSMAHLDAIYIFCGNQARYETWAKEWSKIKGVYTRIQPICEALQVAVKQNNQDSTPISFAQSGEVGSSTNLNQLEPSYMYTQLFKNALLDMKHVQQSREDLVVYCRDTYDGNPDELMLINEFGRNYSANKAIWWYTRQCFTFKMLNQALRLLEADIIVNMGFFLADVHRQIEQLHKQQVKQYHGQSITVYRGQRLSTGDFEKLQKTKGGLISFNSFLSTSREKQVSLVFANDTSGKKDTIGILFVMTIDPKIKTTPFADIENVSYYREAEILFSMHAVFRIGQIKSPDKPGGIFEVQLTLTGDDDGKLRELTEQFDKELKGDTGWKRLGNILIQVSELDKAEELYKTLLGQTLNQSDEALYNHQLGYIKNQQGGYQEAVWYYERTLDIEQKTLPENHPSLATSYNNIGGVYRNMGEYSKALSYYEKALDIFEKTLPENHPSLATSYNNIGLVYDSMEEYSKALSYYEKALDVRQKTLPANHPDFAQSYNNIGGVYDSMGEYSKALSYYEKALDIWQKTLPENHPSLATSYNNIGVVYYNMEDYAKALSFFQQALAIRERSLPPTHPHLLSIRESIEIVKKKL